MAGKLSLLRGAETEPPSQSLLVEQEKIQKEFQYDADVKQLICDMDSAIESIGIRKRSARAAEQAADPEPDISMDDATDAMRDVYNSMARSSAASGAEKLQALHTVMRVLSRAVSHGSWREDMEADDDVTYQKMEPIISFSAKIHKVHSNIRASKGGHVRHNATWAPEEDESLILALRNHGMDAVIPARTEDSVIHRRFKIFMVRILLDAPCLLSFSARITMHSAPTPLRAERAVLWRSGQDYGRLPQVHRGGRHRLPPAHPPQAQARPAEARCASASLRGRRG